MTLRVGKVLMMLRLGSGVLLSNEGDGLRLDTVFEGEAVLEGDAVLEADGEVAGGEVDGVGLTEVFAVDPDVTFVDPDVTFGVGVDV